MALSLLLVTTPALAIDEKLDHAAVDSFRALESVMAQYDQKPLKSFSDDQLASIEGEGFCFSCRSLDVRINVSPIIQIGLVNQFNFAFGNNISQTNNGFVGNTIRFSRHRF
jgi:hypothetical protein